MMQYIAIKRYRRPARGERKAVNIPYGSTLEERDGNLYYRGIEVCSDHAAVMREFFRRNDDGRGLERGKLSQAIVKRMQMKPGETREAFNRRWDVCWNDGLCMRYRKQAQADHFLWDISFFNAPIEDLKYIAALVGAGKGK